MITFKINKTDCMKDDHTIEIIQGNSAVITAQLVDDETGENIILGENDAILWYVKTISGKEIAKRVFSDRPEHFERRYGDCTLLSLESNRTPNCQRCRTTTVRNSLH